MAVGPFALWRPVTTGARPSQRRYLEGSWFDEIAEIYFACGQRGVGPREADELELWEIGGLIGANHPPEPEKSGTQRAGGAAAPSGPNAWNVQRILAMERGEPEPSFDDNPHARSEHWSLIDQARMAGADV